MPTEPTASRSDSEPSPLHPRNRHRERYDFAALVRAVPELARHVVPHPTGGDTVNFADPAAVTALNRALLKHHYGVGWWEIPEGFLCPPVPGRADYLHHVADLLAENAPGRTPPRGSAVRVLDVGVGANCIYPALGVAEYGWSFVGTEADPKALAAAERIVRANAPLAARVELRRQTTPTAIFDGVTRAGERFAVSVCNPPFHASAAEAAAGTRRKLRNLAGDRNVPRLPAATRDGGPEALPLNFGGRSHELWCRGGELGFLRRMVAESAARPGLCGWFTSLVSKGGHVPLVEQALRAARAKDVRVIALAAGQKKARVVAWRF